jgi:hypothetical protein
MRRGRAFRQLVYERGRALRLLTYDQLMAMTAPPVERVSIGGRAGTIAILCRPCEGERVAVVLLGNLATWLPAVSSVARDGFYKHRDGSVSDMHDDDQYAYDHEFPP